MIGRPSQPDLGNTSVGKPDQSGLSEDSAAFPAQGKAAFLLPDCRVDMRSLLVRKLRHTMKGSLYEHPSQYERIR